jgi:hypothetical protein
VKQYPLLNNRAAKVLFALFLTAMLFLSRDTLFSSCLLGFAESQVVMLGLIILLGAAFLWMNRNVFVSILKDRRMLVLLASVLVVVLPMAVVNTGVTVKNGCIINIGALIDHDSVIEDGCHLAPGAIVKAENRIPAGTKVDSGTVIENRQYPL